MKIIKAETTTIRLENSEETQTLDAFRSLVRKLQNIASGNIQPLVFTVEERDIIEKLTKV